ncbi:tRNA-Thr(GGU) m(6)t(6)A37 methyltransferase TsaA [Bdellovibrio bacteriovorus]|uniref:tRNA-Thr(GGU) m(6)t(6)A37 methyltransferase TsaA n=1 Tax=Bdellovibrio bacteriovorus TaxID=959 RepID=A0A150WH91_BDEBC|nr:tRNA (N6-threonylcarbamoyladenosine(37)-N6)-methyltransferase TrmO [Bdellovibrio bacteriovorus]KYG62513.1 tRNA-Thr(GGU) m(6)t(6)A37 methyltransferase TsaA [Bdellovibrio bacteriovorus]
MAQQISITPIGVFHSSQKEPYEAGRQTDEFHSEGVIELSAGENFEQALIGLEGCSHIWVIFHFHHNNHWNPMVLPPRGRTTKIGVFATRSPYRPNGIGMSCVKIKRIEKLKIYVEAADILDGTPVLDIKPYVAYADSFPGVEPAWLADASKYTVSFTGEALEQLEWLDNAGVEQLRGFILHQLEFEPTNSKKKRVKAFEDHFVIAYRTWRAAFTVQEHTVEVYKIFSGYSESDLAASEDTYHDKSIHKEFKKLFPSARP